jgi:hypothetical protein
MKLVKTLIITGITGIAYMLATAEAVTKHYGACTVHRNGVTYKSTKCRVIGDSARFIEAKTGKVHLLLGGVSVTVDNSLPPCID